MQSPQSERDHRRTRSDGIPSDSASPSASRAVRGLETRRSDSIARPAFVLPPLNLPDGGLGLSGLPATLARQSSPTGRDRPIVPLPNVPREGVDLPRIPPAPLPRRDSRNNWEVPLFDDRLHDDAIPETDQDEEVRAVPPGFVGKIMALLGYAGPDAKARRALVSLVFGQLWWFSQFVAVIVLLPYVAHHKSPTDPEITEWTACDRPLGTWNALWLVKLVMSATLSFWNWKRGRAARMRPRRRDSSDTELATQRVLNGRPHYAPALDADPIMPSRRQPPRRTTGLSYEGTSGQSLENGLGRPHTPPSRMYSRLSISTSFLTLAWFLTAHILEYTSVNSCRLTSPHLWWLTFAILCTLYLMILEIFLLGLLVFILGPVLYLIYNILLLCIGRHPLQNPHFIKPDITKIPKSVVDQIPLVLYIPPPPGETTDTTPSVPAPLPAHLYPPKSPTPSSAAPKRRFMFFRRKGKKPSSGKADPARKRKGLEAGYAANGEMRGEEEEEEEEDVPWDEMWEKGEYPFVRLEGNRAVCAICIMDFEEPRRVRGAKGTGPGSGSGSGSGADAAAKSAFGRTGDGNRSENENEIGQRGAEEATQEVQVEAVTEEEREDALKLSDAGEGAQPLRLLSCGHVFHKTCLDPWLTDVSGRCPICQRPVEIPQPTKKDKRRRRRG